MKKVLSVILVVFLLTSVCSADEAKAVSWHSIFGLSEGATEEEISNAIQKTFSVEPSSVDAHNYYPKNKYFYGLPVKWAIIHSFTLNQQHSGLEISFEDESLSAKNIEMLYQQFCNEFGEPTVCNISKEIITINGKGEEPINIDDLESIQLAIDQNIITGTICWDNISIGFQSSVYNAKPFVTFEIDAAFSEASLNKKVKDLYGIKTSLW